MSGLDSIRRHLSGIAFSERFGRQMRFVAGPRQCGKTTIARRKLLEAGSNLYYNWDQREVRARFRTEGDFLGKDLLESRGGVEVWACLDEIHKAPAWKNILKGLFDAHEERVRLIVTGSARLDRLRASGESLAGRYFLFRLNPLTLSEAEGSPLERLLPEEDARAYIEKAIQGKGYSQGTLEQLLAHSGFPEPFLKADPVFHRKWGEESLERIVREDLRDLSRIHQLDRVLDLLHLLPARVGAPLSVSALREDLELNFNTVRNYVRYLALACVIFEVPPYSRRGRRLVKKERKIYFYDWTRVPRESFRFENYVAVELKARVDLWNDAQERAYELHMVRGRDGAETDFLLTRDDEPWLLLEAKSSSAAVDAHHRRHSAMLGSVPFVQLVREPEVLRVEPGGCCVVSASRFFS